jgi:hypothetical protein
MLRVRWDRAGRVGLLVVLTVVVGLYVQHTLAYLSTKSQADRQQTIVDRDDRARCPGAGDGPSGRAPVRDHRPRGPLTAIPRDAGGRGPA